MLPLPLGNKIIAWKVEGWGLAMGCRCCGIAALVCVQSTLPWAISKAHLAHRCGWQCAHQPAGVAFIKCWLPAYCF